jgi:TAP-like protein
MTSRPSISWPAGAPPPPPAAGPTTPPLTGTADTADPPANVAGATATMPNALLVSVPGTGHWTLANATDPGCLLAATTAFIQAGQPASPASWNACTRALADELVPFPAP